jgi:phage terminase large subunit
MKEIWEGLGVEKYFKEEKQFLNYYFGKNWLHFGSLDSPEKIKSSEFNYIWMEEANEFRYEDYTILKLRLSAPATDGHRNQLFISFNPQDAFCFLKTKILDNSSEDSKEIVSNYKDNPFLSPDYIKTLLALENQDQNFYRIFCLGQWGQLTDLIFTNWDECDEMPACDEDIYGLDFGFVHPTCLVKLAIFENDIWIQEKLYQSGLTNSDIIRNLPILIPNKNSEIFADSEDPNRIEEIFRAGFNIHPVEKGAGSVKSGINFLKCRKLHITRDSVNILKEIKSYSYKKDKSGNVIEEPVKYNDDGMDALRYGVFSKSQQTEPSIRWL